MKSEIKWIDCAKAVAILAVLVDHTYGTLYTNSKIQTFSFFSVSLFILLSGMTLYLSYQRNSEKKVINRIYKILIPYIIATFIYQLVICQFFDFSVFLDSFIHFKIAGPFYFVFLYIQLLLISRVLFFIIKKASIFQEVLLFVVIIVVSYYTSNYTNILDIYGGGGKLFGGTYLILFYLGMIFSKYNIFKTISKKNSIILLVIFGGLFLSWYRFICADNYKFDSTIGYVVGINPPNISLMLLALFMLFSVFSLFTLLENTKYLKVIVHIFSRIGKCSLYIFLYHGLFLEYLLPYFYDIIENKLLRCFIYFGVMIIGSMSIKQCLELVAKSLNNNNK